MVCDCVLIRKSSSENAYAERNKLHDSGADLDCVYSWAVAVYRQSNARGESLLS